MEDVLRELSHTVAQRPDSLDEAIDLALLDQSYRISLFKRDCIRNRQDPRAQLKRILDIYRRQSA
jgi:hypothetical protein